MGRLEREFSSGSSSVWLRPPQAKIDSRKDETLSLSPQSTWYVSSGIRRNAKIFGQKGLHLNVRAAMHRLLNSMISLAPHQLLLMVLSTATFCHPRQTSFLQPPKLLAYSSPHQENIPNFGLVLRFASGGLSFAPYGESIELHSPLMTCVPISLSPSMPTKLGERRSCATLAGVDHRSKSSKTPWKTRTVSSASRCGSSGSRSPCGLCDHRTRRPRGGADHSGHSQGQLCKLDQSYVNALKSFPTRRSRPR